MRIISPRRNLARLMTPILVIAIFAFFSDFSPLSAQTFAPPPASPTPPATPQGGSAATPPAQPAAPDVGTMLSLSGANSGMNPNKVYTGERISLDFQNADIHNILRLIGEVSGMNVVVSDQVQGKVTLKLKDVPWDQALDIVLASKNLGMERNDNVIRIDTLAAIRSATLDSSDPTIRIPLSKKIYTPKYSAVSAMAAEMEKARSIRGSVRVIGNDIYVEDDESTLEALDALFQRNDRVTKQILIEARIVEASTTFAQQLGIRWGAGFDRTPGGGNNWGERTDMQSGDPLTGGYVPGEMFGLIDQTGGNAYLGFGFLNRAGTLMLNAELNAHETVNDTKTVSSPRILAANDQEVYIKQGQQIPYTTGGTTAGTTASTSFKDATMELRVTPHIEENGQIVTLDITLTKDSLGGLAPNGEVLIETKEARTKLMVRNGETVVIGGIITDDQTSLANRVPGLHAVPLLGWLFNDRSISNQKRELLIFITANIIPITV